MAKIKVTTKDKFTKKDWIQIIAILIIVGIVSFIINYYTSQIN